jgi:2-(1,2-epoxy-1,2-dihydrophenyl)acetyl-CoA isomerase
MTGGRPQASGADVADVVTVARPVDHVACVEWHRQPNNHIDAPLLRAVVDACDELQRDRRTRAIVLCSEGKHFCGGANFEPTSAPRDGQRDELYAQAVRLFALELPMVAAVQGAAVGGGLGLALAADFRVASADSRFAANFSRIGYHHGFGLSVTLPRLIGNQAALDLLLTGRRVGGEEAARLGLCDRVVGSAEIRAESVALASVIAASAPLSVRAIRATLRGGLAEAIATALERERLEQARLKSTWDFTEGVAASMERRDPEFRGE